MKSKLLIIILGGSLFHAPAVASNEAPASPDLVTVTATAEATPSPAPISIRATRIVVGEGRNATWCVSIDVTYRNVNEYSVWTRGASQTASSWRLEKWSEDDADWKRIGFAYRPEGAREIEAGAEQRLQLAFSESDFGPDTRVVFEYFDDPEFKSSNRIEAFLPQPQVDDDPAEATNQPVNQ